MRIAFGLAFLCAACVFACGSSSSSNKAGGGIDTGGSASGGTDSFAGADTSGGGSDSTGNGGSGATHHGGSSSSTGGDTTVMMMGEAGEAGSGPVVVQVVSTGKPHAAGGLVAGAVVAHSTNFTGIFSLGASPGGNGLLTSKTAQLRGGVVGASQQ